MRAQTISNSILRFGQCCIIPQQRGVKLHLNSLRAQGYIAKPSKMSKDAQVIDAILKEMSVTDYEPRVVHQLMEFTNRYVTGVLQEAQVFSSYAKKSTIDLNDVQLAVNMQTDKTVASPPPKELLLEIAREKNNQPLPSVKSHNGLRIPFDKYTLIGTNFKLASVDKEEGELSETPTQ